MNWEKLLEVVLKIEDLKVFGGFVRSTILKTPHESDFDIISRSKEGERELFKALDSLGEAFDVEDISADGYGTYMKQPNLNLQEYDAIPPIPLVRVHFEDGKTADICRAPTLRADFAENFLTLTERGTAVKALRGVNGWTLPDTTILVENLKEKTLTPFPTCQEVRREKFKKLGFKILPTPEKWVSYLGVNTFKWSGKVGGALKSDEEILAEARRNQQRALGAQQQQVPPPTVRDGRMTYAPGGLEGMGTVTTRRLEAGAREQQARMATQLQAGLIEQIRRGNPTPPPRRQPARANDLFTGVAQAMRPTYEWTVAPPTHATNQVTYTATDTLDTWTTDTTVPRR